MAIDIAAMTAQQKLDYAQAVGQVLLVGGSLGAAQTDIALPSGYIKFVLELIDVKLDSRNNVSFRTSSDGGISYHSEATDYKNVWDGFPYGDTHNTVFSDSDEDDNGYIIQDASAAGVGCRTKVEIFPGSASSYFTARSDTLDVNASNSRVDVFPNIETLGSVMVAETARQNSIRVGPYFGSGSLLTSGVYRLYGFG